jgi:DNA-binding MarR family transcriptional regulator
LAPNTASTLVSKLAADGLLIRTVDADDRRVGRLRLTEPAQRIADESRAARRAALSAVLDELEPGQLVRLERGLEVLAEMTRMLHERQP